MSHVSQPAADSSGSEWDDQDADSGRIVSVPGPGASKEELLEVRLTSDSSEYFLIFMLFTPDSQSVASSSAETSRRE